MNMISVKNENETTIRAGGMHACEAKILIAFNGPVASVSSMQFLCDFHNANDLILFGCICVLLARARACLCVDEFSSMSNN